MAFTCVLQQGINGGVLGLLVMVYTDNLKGRDPFDTQIKNKCSLAAFSQKMALEKLETLKKTALYITCDFSYVTAFACFRIGN